MGINVGSSCTYILSVLVFEANKSVYMLFRHSSGRKSMKGFIENWFLRIIKIYKNAFTYQVCLSYSWAFVAYLHVAKLRNKFVMVDNGNNNLSGKIGANI